MRTTASTRRPLLAAAAFVLLSIAGTGCLPSKESDNATVVNSLRAAVALPALARSAELDAKAKAQADQMAAHGYIFHSADLAAGVPAGWGAIGENVAVAGSVEAAQAALEASPPHYANLTNPVFNELGVGVTELNGVVYVVQVFVGR